MLGSQLVAKTHQIRSPESHFFKFPGGACPQTTLEDHVVHTVYFTCRNLLSPKKFPPSSKKSCMKPCSFLPFLRAATVLAVQNFILQFMYIIIHLRKYQPHCSYSETCVLSSEWMRVVAEPVKEHNHYFCTITHTHTVGPSSPPPREDSLTSSGDYSLLQDVPSNPLPPKPVPPSLPPKPS